jgi:hypothetical protein
MIQNIALVFRYGDKCIIIIYLQCYRKLTISKLNLTVRHNIQYFILFLLGVPSKNKIKMFFVVFDC